MDIIGALQQEESKLQGQLTAIKSVIAVLNDKNTSSANGRGSKRTMSAAARAKIGRAAKARWAKFRAAKAKKLK